jgi:hypothetical protein
MQSVYAGLQQPANPPLVLHIRPGSHDFSTSDMSVEATLPSTSTHKYCLPEDCIPRTTLTLSSAWSAESPRRCLHPQALHEPVSPVVSARVWLAWTMRVRPMLKLLSKSFCFWSYSFPSDAFVPTLNEAQPASTLAPQPPSLIQSLKQSETGSGRLSLTCLPLDSSDYGIVALPGV